MLFIFSFIKSGLNLSLFGDNDEGVCAAIWIAVMVGKHPTWPPVKSHALSSKDGQKLKGSESFL